MAWAAVVRTGGTAAAAAARHQANALALRGGSARLFATWKSACGGVAAAAGGSAGGAVVRRLVAGAAPKAAAAARGGAAAAAAARIAAGAAAAAAVAGWVHNGRALCSAAVAPRAAREPATPTAKQTSAVAVDDDDDLDWALLWELIRPDIVTLGLAVASAVGAAVVNVKLTKVLGDLVNAVTSAADGHGGDAALRASAGAVLGLAGVQAGFTFAYIALLSAVGERLCDRMRCALFSAMLRQDVLFFDQRKSGELMDRLTADVDAFRSAFKQVVSQGLRNLTQALGSAAAMFLVSRELAAGVTVLVPVVVAGGTLFGGALRQLSRQAKAATAEAHGVAGEVLANVRTVKSFAAEDTEEARFGRLAARCRGLSIYLGVGIGLFAGATHMFTNGLVLSVLYYGGQLMARGDLSAGDLMRFLVSAQTIQRSVSHMSVLLGTAMRGADAGARVLQYLKMTPTHVTGALDGLRPVVTGNIELRDVEFTYPTRPGQLVLDKLTLKVAAGTVVALCGPSGAGKSTVAAMIERFYDPDAGAVLIDGVDMRELDTHYIRKNIGYINQEPVLFSGTVLDNIKYGRPEATMEEVERAARRANAHNFIERFPNGYNTVVGERGVTVSGGQKQRIAIARALVKNPKILILDEATSALDSESEALVQEALNALSVGRTVVVIAHRLSTIMGADQIVVLDGGRIAEQGTHDRLLAQGGLYTQLVRQQIEARRRK